MAGDALAPPGWPRCCSVPGWVSGFSPPSRNAAISAFPPSEPALAAPAFYRQAAAALAGGEGKEKKKKKKNKGKKSLKTILLSFFSPPGPLRGDQVSHVIYKFSHTHTHAALVPPWLHPPTVLCTAHRTSRGSGDELPTPAPSRPTPSPSTPQPALAGTRRPRDTPPGSRAPAPRPGYL